MSYTFTEHTGDGAQVTFPFRFAGRDKGYLKAADIVVEKYVDNTWVEDTAWQLSGTNQITFNLAPAAGLKFRIRRVVEKDFPYAEFDRGVTLDMKSLNNSFIHILDIAQEILDGFYPDGYFIKQNVDWGGNRITNLGDGIEDGDAVNKGQLDAVDKKHTEWNTQQDMVIEGLKKGMTSGVSHRTVPWYTVAQGGEVKLNPPYEFEDALVFINGILQFEMAGAISIANNTINFAEPLLQGMEVLVLIGSRVATPVSGDMLEWSMGVSEGTDQVDIGTAFSSIELYLDGLHQPHSAYTVNGTVISFTESLPACTVTANITLV